MDPYERLVRQIAGEAIDRPLNFDIVMTFAAHYVGQPLSRYYLDHRVLVEANLAVQEAFELDIVQAISDPYRRVGQTLVGYESITSWLRVDYEKA
jgi:hypothetical protein